ncbi:MAG: cation diffusion facilitator family transporter [Lachnospiraceae bacterium]
MITILSNLFMKNKENYEDQKVRLFFGILCGIIGIALNVLLFLCKLLAGLFSNSIAITADAFNNLSDAGSSIITLLGFKLSNQKPDPDHPFGHGRIEYLSGLFVSMLIILMAVELFKTSIEKIITPTQTEFNTIILLILIGSIFVKCYMAFYNRKVGKAINSAAMLATATDSLSDCFATLVVLISSILSYYTALNIDAYCGLLVSIIICIAGINAAKETIDPLLGQAPEPDFVKKVESIVNSYPLILGIHDLIVHNYGPGRVMISLHAEVSSKEDLLVIHDMIDVIERRLNQELLCESVIHMDPIVMDDSEINLWKEQTLSVIGSIDSDISLHDFRMVKGDTHSNLVFDILVPFHLKLSDTYLITCIEEKLREIDSNIYAVITVDRSYIS